MSATDPVVIVSAARTPMGGFLGDLAGLSAAELGLGVKGEAGVVGRARLLLDEGGERGVAPQHLVQVEHHVRVVVQQLEGLRRGAVKVQISKRISL